MISVISVIFAGASRVYVLCVTTLKWRLSPSVDMEPPRIKCPHVKDKWAEPGKLTARVTWDTPEGVDTADGILTESVPPPPPFLSLYFDFCFDESFWPTLWWEIKAEPASFFPCSVILKGKPSKSDFPEGLHKMSYTVFDRAGNKGSCRFTIRVRGKLLTPVSDIQRPYSLSVWSSTFRLLVLWRVIWYFSL